MTDNNNELGLEADLSTVTDNEYFEALAKMPVLIDADTDTVVDPWEGVRDERNS